MIPRELNHLSQRVTVIVVSPDPTQTVTRAITPTNTLFGKFSKIAEKNTVETIKGSGKPLTLPDINSG